MRPCEAEDEKCPVEYEETKAETQVAEAEAAARPATSGRRRQGQLEKQAAKSAVSKRTA